jgi:hypothetical protein
MCMHYADIGSIHHFKSNDKWKKLMKFVCLKSPPFYYKSLAIWVNGKHVSCVGWQTTAPISTLLYTEDFDTCDTWLMTFIILVNSMLSLVWLTSIPITVG